MSEPYYTDASVALYLGDMREIVPALDVQPDCIVTDPPYGETSLEWDRWPDGWPTVAAGVASSMWCFGSARMFWDHKADFSDWRLSQDVIWEKTEGMGVATDRFRRVHEHAWHFYRGVWGEVHHVTPRTRVYGSPVGRRVTRAASEAEWHGERGAAEWVDDGTRITRSVIKVPNMRLRGFHPTEKPAGILSPLIEYACPPGGLVLDPFAGSGSTAVAARLSGRRAVLIEAREDYCALTARRLAQDVLPFGEVSA